MIIQVLFYYRVLHFVAMAIKKRQCSPFFISTTGKGVFQTRRALEGISAYYVCSVHLYGIDI